MHQLSLTNSTLLKSLSNLTESVFDSEEVISNLSARCGEYSDKLNTTHIGYSDSYLEKALTFPVTDYAFPRTAFGLDTSYKEKRQSGYWHDIAKPLLRPIMNYIGSHFNALCMYYPANGYIGWHHNGNAAGYNFILTYSMDGDGYFRYYNQKTNEYTTLQDVPGWNFRFGYYPNQDREPENVFWHTAYTKKPRVTIGFIIPHRELWKSLVEECCDLSELHFDINEVGPKVNVQR